jgi:hypothetical protein
MAILFIFPSSAKKNPASCCEAGCGRYFVIAFLHFEIHTHLPASQFSAK